ncbi:MAG: hypothetical protein ABJ327_01325 [Litoreibacter sp.]
MASSKKTPPKSKNSRARGQESTDAIDAEIVDEKSSGATDLAPTDAADIETSDLETVSTDVKDVDVEEAPKDMSEDALVDDMPREEEIDAFVSEDDPATADEENAPSIDAPVLAQPQRSYFWPLFLGGATAAVLGFVLAWFLVPEGWPWRSHDELVAKLDVQAETISAAETAIDEASARIDALETQVSEITARLDATLTGAGNIPGDLAVLLATQREEIAALQDSLKDMAQYAEGQIQTAQERADSAARAEARAKARDAMNTVRLALSNGGAFADELEVISEAIEIPAELSAGAQGIATQVDLEDSFGSAARQALAASNRELSGDSAGDRVKLLLQDVIGARSLSPQEGDSPDAVLSRLEGSLRNGDLAAALETAQSLPQSGQDALASWLEAAATRNGALNGFSNILDALSAD